MMRPCVAAHALSTVVLAALLHAQADLHRTSDDGSIKRPVEAPLRMRLFNPRAGDPRRRVGDLSNTALVASPKGFVAQPFQAALVTTNRDRCLFFLEIALAVAFRGKHC